MKENRSSIITWGVVIALLVVSAVVSASWSSIRESLPIPELDLTGVVGGDEVDLPPPASDVAPISLDFIPLPQLQDVSLSPLVAMAILGALVTAPIVGLGVILAIGYSRLANVTEEVKESEEFKEDVAQLEKMETELLRAKRQAQPATPIPDHTRSRWSSISTILIGILFAIFLGTAIGNAFIPGGEVVREGDQVVNVGSQLAWALIFLVLFVGAVLLRPNAIRQIDANENGPIPWGLVWAVISGALMVGLGSGIILFLSSG